MAPVTSMAHFVLPDKLAQCKEGVSSRFTKDRPQKAPTQTPNYLLLGTTSRTGPFKKVLYLKGALAWEPMNLGWRMGSLHVPPLPQLNSFCDAASGMTNPTTQQTDCLHTIGIVIGKGLPKPASIRI